MSRKLFRSRLTFVSLVFIAIFTFVLVSELDSGNAQRRDAADKSGGDSAPLIPIIPPGSAYRTTHLMSDIPGYSPVLDPLLVNPWGISLTASSPFWISNNGTSTTQLIRGDVAGAPVVLNPSPQTVTLPGGLPTGTVANPVATEFVLPGACASVPCGANFLFASITGNIVGWDPNAPAAGSTTGVIAANHPGHVYTGLAYANNGSANFLYAADFANGKIDVFNTTFALQPPASFTFADPTIPTTAGNTFHPYNIQAIGGSLYVMYAKVGTGGLPEDGVGNGFVRRFGANGVRDLTFGINNGPLNAPWGATIAPATFGIFGGGLLIGNFGEGNPSIHAFNPTTGAFLGTIQDESGNGIEIDELWDLKFGNGGSGGDVNTLYFTAGTAEEEHGLFGKLNPTTASATSLIQFATDDIAFNEAGGHVDVTVIRAGDVSGLASVSFNTLDQSQPDHASQKSDFEIALGRLTFAPGETSKTFRVFFVNDNFDENNETIDLTLSNPIGAGVGLGSPNHAELTILDDDTGASAANPIDDPAIFTRQLYLDLLNREPAPVELSAGVASITSCGSLLPCVGTRRAELATNVILSAEFAGHGSLLIRANRAVVGPPQLTSTSADMLYGDFEDGLQAIDAGGPAMFETNKQAYFNAFTGRPVFQAKFPPTLTNAQYVDLLIANTGATFPAGFRDALVDSLNNAFITRAQALRAVAEHSSYAAFLSTRIAPALVYFGFDRRDPDTGGFNAFVNRINTFGGDGVRSNIVRSFITSLEYRQRFGPDTSPGVYDTNRAPFLQPDFATSADTNPFVINVLGNDFDIDGDFLVITSVTPGTGGTPTVSPDGRSITFTSSAAGAPGTFQYTVTDNGMDHPGQLNVTPNAISRTTTVLINGTLAAGVTVSGRVLTTDGRGIRNAQVTITNESGVSRSVLTGPRGQYRFEDIESGHTYVVSATSRRFSFEPRVVNVTDNLTDVDLIGSTGEGRGKVAGRSP